jgi:hypothetical protein
MQKMLIIVTTKDNTVAIATVISNIVVKSFGGEVGGVCVGNGLIVVVGLDVFVFDIVLVVDDG